MYMGQNMKNCNCSLGLVTRITVLLYTFHLCDASLPRWYDSSDMWIYPFIHTLFNFKKKIMGV